MPPRGTPLDAVERNLVKQEILFWHHRKWHVHALSVMPTHVHVLATPLEAGRGEWYALSEILHSVKRGSAWRVNRLRGARGPVWAKESYDHFIRHEREWSAAFDYLLANAVGGGYEGDPYEYDGFWCESMEGLHGAEIVANTALLTGAVPRVKEGSSSQRRRRLPHLELPGGTYHIVFSLRGHRVPAPLVPGTRMPL